MKSGVKEIELTKYDDLFKDEDTRQDEKLERIQIIPADQVFPYERQPYSIDRATPDLARLMESIERVGISEPLIARPREGGGYEIISGHRRDYCAKKLGIPDRPVIVRQYTDEEADILVADYNINRENLFPSEKARAYKLKLDAMKRQGQRTDLTSLQVGEKLKGKASVQILAQQSEENATTIQRYIRLNNLVPQLLEAVDRGALKLTPAADLVSHLSEKEQSYLALVMERDEISPSMKQAQRLKEFSEAGKLQESTIDAIMSEEKPLDRKVVLDGSWVNTCFAKNMTPQQIKDRINKALDLLERTERRRQEPER